MGYLIFLLRGQFCERAPGILRKEHRIIAEAAVSVALEQDVSRTLAARDDLLAVRRDEGDNADEFCGPLPFRDVSELFQQIVDAIGVAGAVRPP